MLRRLIHLKNAPRIYSSTWNFPISRTFCQCTQATIIDGKKIAADIRKELKGEVERWIARGNRRPCLVAVLVGDDPASEKYVHFKMLAAEEVGIRSRTLRLPAASAEAAVVAAVERLNADPEVDGVLVQLPLPAHVGERAVCNAVDPRKDVDGFHMLNVGRLALNMDALVPATALGVAELLRRARVGTFGKNVLVCGRSKNVGLPMALLLHSDARNECPGMEATVVICHRNTPEEELRYFAKRADVIISATGVVGLIKKEMVKPGACVIDVGITRVTTEEGKSKIVGDVDFEGVRQVAGHITPVPGGVGPMTVAMLMSNTLKAAMSNCSESSE